MAETCFDAKHRRGFPDSRLAEGGLAITWRGFESQRNCRERRKPSTQWVDGGTAKTSYANFVGLTGLRLEEATQVPPRREFRTGIEVNTMRVHYCAQIIIVKVRKRRPNSLFSTGLPA